MRVMLALVLCGISLFLPGCHEDRDVVQSPVSRNGASGKVSSEEFTLSTRIEGLRMWQDPIPEPRRLSFHYVAKLQAECGDIRFVFVPVEANPAETRRAYKSAFESAKPMSCACQATIGGAGVNHTGGDYPIEDAPSISFPLTVYRDSEGEAQREQRAFTINGMTIRERPGTGFNGIQVSGTYTGTRSCLLAIDFSSIWCLSLKPFTVYLSNGMSAETLAVQIAEAFDLVNRRFCGIDAVAGGSEEGWYVTFGILDNPPSISFELFNEHEVTVDNLRLRGESSSLTSR